MSQSVLKKQPEDINKDKIISKSNKPNKISKLTNYNFRNDSLINFLQKKRISHIKLIMQIQKEILKTLISVQI